MEKSKKSHEPGRNEKKLSRRDFLKNVGFLGGGVAITSIAMSSGCSSGDATTTPPATTANGATTTPPATTTSPAPGTTTTPSKTNNGDDSITSRLREYNVVEIEGCTTHVAGGRLYSEEHLWVYTYNNKAVIGFSDKLQALFGIIAEITYPRVGDTLKRDSLFAYTEGHKMIAELHSPVSGVVVERNNTLHMPPYNYPERINRSPYIDGWIVVVELSDPDELDDLWTAEEYAWEQREVD